MSWLKTIKTFITNEGDPVAKSYLNEKVYGNA